MTLTDSSLALLLGTSTFLGLRPTFLEGLESLVGPSPQGPQSILPLGSPIVLVVAGPSPRRLRPCRVYERTGTTLRRAVVVQLVEHQLRPLLRE